MRVHIKNEYDTLSTTPASSARLRDAQFYLRRHLRRRGLLREVGPGRLARFREIAKYKPVTTNDIVEGRLDDVYVAEFRHYVWRIKPRCAYCDAALTRDSLTRDHVIPRSKGGGGGDNLVPSCGPCNRAKANHSLLSFLVQRRSSLRKRAA